MLLYDFMLSCFFNFVQFSCTFIWFLSTSIRFWILFFEHFSGIKTIAASKNEFQNMGAWRLQQMFTDKKVSIKILLKNDVELNYYQFRSTVKIYDHSLYTQIIIKKIFTFFLFRYKKRKCQTYQQKKEKQNLILMIWFLEKSLIYQAILILNTTLLNH